MRASGVIEDIPIHILGYFRNSERINALLAGLHAGQAARVIHLGDPVGAIVRAKARVDAGEFVALLGDRVGLNERVVKARFLGAEAAFPAGPFLLAASIGCPVLLVFGLYRAPNRYDLHCEPFAERLLLPRKEREQRLALEVQRYAQRLEDYCRRAPDNWFNFFDFWGNP
jgi:predicted LPLAT superfamily acyltransferase